MAIPPLEITLRAPEGVGVAFQPVARNRVLAWLGLFGSLAATALLPALVGVTAYGIVGSLWAILSLHYGQPSAPGQGRMRAATLEVDDAALTVRFLSVGVDPIGAIVRRHRIARETIAEGWVDSFGGHHTAVLRMQNGDQVWIGQPSASAANDLLCAVGVAPEQQVFSARLSSRAARVKGGVAAAALALFAAVPVFIAAVTALILTGRQPLVGAAVASAIAFGCFKLLQAIIPPRAVVGTDGVRIEGLAQKRFVSYGDVTHVDCDARGVWLRKSDGDVLLPTGRPATTARAPRLASANTIAVHHRVQQAMAVGRSAAVPQTKLELLDRKGRTVSEWLRDLAGLQQAHTGYRQVSIDRDELLAVLLDSAASVERRIAAAAALARRGDAELRQRVRIAGEACANERLRIAIDATAGDEIDEDAVELALEEAERAETSAA